jgi:hypothetical protein
MASSWFTEKYQALLADRTRRVERESGLVLTRSRPSLDSSRGAPTIRDATTPPWPARGAVASPATRSHNRAACYAA